MKLKSILCLFILSSLLYSCTANIPPHDVLLFTQDWKFTLEPCLTANETAFDDSGWRTLDLPHDWSVESQFLEDAPATPGGGALPGGIGWYRKSFKVPKSAEGKKVFINFDGVYWDSEVWINGVSLGRRPNGYISFQYDLTPFLNFGKANVIAVRVDNSNQPNSRWYTGSGIYRPVYLEILNPVHISRWGVSVTTPEVSEKESQIAICIDLKNETEADEKVQVLNVIKDSTGAAVAQATTEAFPIKAGNDTTISQKILLSAPTLWSDTNPYLYTLETSIIKGEKTLDITATSFGVRTFRFDPEKGFFLNGVPTKIKGVCNHHDLGCLGTAVNYRAIERQLQILKEMGCNGIRTSHNPPATELLDLCDRMGFIVMDEAFDVWRKKKTPFDYSHYFPEWHERDIKDFILRDRNHPSIFMWSIGNEVLEQWSHIDADTLDIAQANMILNFATQLNKKDADTSLHINSIITSKLASIVRDIDTTRPITAGCNEASPDNHLFRSEALDIIGFNYQYYAWGKESVSKNFPGKPLILTETTSGLMTRGFYMMPSDSSYIWPLRWDIPFDRDVHYCSSYDNCHVPWGTTHEKTWQMVKKQDHISGMYIWTGFDYLGEPTPFGWPSRSSYFGIIDLAGFPKDIYYMYQSEWSDKDVLHLFPHWNWNDGEIVDLWVYYNHADEVELFINGKSMGRKGKKGEELHLSWRVPFEAGTVKAVAYQDGKAVRENVIKTTGESSTIRMTPDRSVITADGRDLSFVTVEVLDMYGNPVPTAANLINFSVNGDGTIVGTDNGSEIESISFKNPHRHLFNGKCLVVLQSDENAGEITLRATSAGLPDASTTITTIN